MKWLVYLLVLANAGFFARQYYLMSNAPPPPPQTVTPYDHVNRLLLIGETDPKSLRPRKPSPEPPVAEAATADPSAELPFPAPAVASIAEQNCYSIGPLNDNSQIASLRTWLASLGGTPVLRVDERQELARYWVYLPPLGSLEEAQQKVERMHAQGIEDVIAVSKGDSANSISLGVFSQRDSLERRLRELRELGYEPLILPRYRTENASWLDVSFDQGERLTRDELAARFPDAELSETSCTSGEIARGRPGF